MKNGTPIFKIQKIQQFVNICETSLFEISNFYEQNHFITKTYDWRTRLMQEWTHFQLDSGRFGSKCLLILKMGIPVFIGASWMQCTELC